jgi:hypothetical protein
MKIKLLSFLVAIPMFLVTTVSFGQTTLAVGDIVIFQNQADTPDDFAFVTFVDIDAGTGIYFTDCGVNASGFRLPACTEGAFKYTVPAGGLSAGDIVRLSTNSADFAVYNDTRITGSSGPALATSGDQVVAFQDATNAAGGTDAANNPTFLFIIHNSSTQFTGNPADSNESSLPPGLDDTTPPRSALGLGAGPGVDVEWDNTVYNGTYDFSGFATTAEAITAARLAMTDPANYTQENGITSGTYPADVAAIPTELNLTTLSTDEFTGRSFSLYPNPSNGNITIRNAGVALQNVTVTDVNGRTVGSYEMNGITTDTNLSLNLTTGMYFVKLTSDNASTTKKLVIK